MGYHYIHIDSKDRKEYESSSKMTIHLSNPIHKAKSVRVQSFSCANEFYNVLEGNNYFIFLIYTISGGVVNTDPTVITLVLEPDLYTISDMVDTLQDAINEFTSAELESVTISFTLLADNKVQIVCTSAQNLPRRVTLFYAGNDDKFYSSIIYRLGFSRQQVCPFANSFINDENGQIVALTPIGYVPEDEATYLIFKTNSTTLTDKTKSSNNIGFENHPYLYLKSNELVKHATKTHKNTDGSSATAHTNILQKIPISVNIYSWIHLFGSEAIYEHDLDGRTINDFDIELTNHLHSTFPSQHFKDFTLDLIFETIDENEQINDEAIKALSQKGFLLRHNCL